MIFNDHSKLAGLHAFLSASKYHWVNYDEDKLSRMYAMATAAQRGTELHDFAHRAIRLGQRLQGNKTTMAMYVNDAIGFRMTPEVMLFYSVNAFGTADAISFSRNKLRIHDLKTGESKTSMTQLMIYVAFFCLEYDVKPAMIDIKLRIYQNNDFEELTPDVDDIMHIMETIKRFDNLINEWRMEEAS